MTTVMEVYIELVDAEARGETVCGKRVGSTVVWMDWWRLQKDTDEERKTDEDRQKNWGSRFIL